MTQLRRAEMFRIASAIVTAWPRDCGRLVDHIGVLPGTEVRHVENSRIIVVIEGEDERAIRNCLAEIAAMRETLSVNLVFEHFERLGLPGDEP